MSMEQSRERYRRLPGRRRGFIYGSSVWLGSDHLLLVKSQRFREEYKRFYFRDIQAIVTARAPRFHFSTRAAMIGWVWFCLIVFLSGVLHGVGEWLGWGCFAGNLLLFFVWAYVSAKCSCRTRIYTAVSSEELRSLYRNWTARRFLAKVEPLLAQAQGVIEGNWADAVEDREIGAPAEGRIGLMTPGPASPVYLTPPPAPPPASAPARTPISLLFVASLFLGGLAELLTMRAGAGAGLWILLVFFLLQDVAAVAVMVQAHLGGLQAAVRTLALGFVVFIGLWFYGVQAVTGAAVGYQNSRNPNSVNVQAGAMEPLIQMGQPLSRGLAGGIALLFGLAGVLLMLRGEQLPKEKVSFNV